MKKILLFVVCAAGLFTPSLVKAQTFTIQADTVYANVSTVATVFDSLTNTSGSTLSLSWHVTGTNFPSDWLADSVLGICDANLCRQNASGQLWNGTSGTTFTCPYTVTTHLFDLSLNLTGASNGSHYITINISNTATFESKRMTFVINKFPTAVSNVNADNDISMYPNPAHEELNILFNANADVHNIAVYNIIGKVMMVYKVTGASANLNLENIPAGVYFVRLTNSRGEMVTTKKFTKQ